MGCRCISVVDTIVSDDDGDDGGGDAESASGCGCSERGEPFRNVDVVEYERFDDIFETTRILSYLSKN